MECLNIDVVVASPSFSVESGGMWRYHDQHNENFAMRYTNFIECLGPVLSTAFVDSKLFQKCLSATRTGYYIDNCFGPISEKLGGKVGIIDRAVCIHPDRPVSEKEMYNELSDAEHARDYRFFDEVGVPRSVYWFREPEYFGGERMPHLFRIRVPDQALGLLPKEIHNRMIRTLFPTRFGPLARIDPEGEDFETQWEVPDE